MSLLADVRPVDFHYVALQVVKLVEVTFIDIRFHGLRHSANNHVLAKEFHDIPVQGVAEGAAVGKAFAYIVHQVFLAHVHRLEKVDTKNFLMVNIFLKWTLGVASLTGQA